MSFVSNPANIIRTYRSQLNGGAYLVQGPGHCGACHTPKTWLGGDKTSEALRGYTLQGWTASDITSGQGALGNWSVDDVASYLKTGHNRNAAAAGLMSEVVSLSTSKIIDDDIKAMAVYLKDVSGPAPEAASSPDKNVMAAGKAIYQDLCSSCHTPDGKGGAQPVPEPVGGRDRFGSRSRHGVTCDPARCPERRKRSRADRSGDAGVRLATQRRAGGGGRYLRPQ